MNKKVIIQIVIIVAAFGAAGYILYNGLFKNNTSLPPAGQSTTASVENLEILPYGSSLDFSKAINTRRFRYGILAYPKLDPKSEVGIPLENLITPEEKD